MQQDPLSVYDRSLSSQKIYPVIVKNHFIGEVKRIVLFDQDFMNRFIDTAQDMRRLIEVGSPPMDTDSDDDGYVDQCTSCQISEMPDEPEAPCDTNKENESPGTSDN